MKTIIGILYIILGIVLIIDGSTKLSKVPASSIVEILFGLLLIGIQYSLYRKYKRIGPPCYCYYENAEKCSIKQNQKTS